MKRSINYSLRLCMLAGLLLVSGCTSEEMGADGASGSDEVVFSLSLPEDGARTRALNASAESEIRTLDVLVFKEVAPGQEVFDYRFPVSVSAISGGSPRQFRAKVKLLNERQNFVLLANAGAEVNLLSAAGQSKADVLQNLIIANTGKWNVGTNHRALPMWGETGWVTVSSSASTLPSPITLYRMQAKIDLRLSATAQAKFALKEVYLFNHNTRGRLVPDAGNWSSGTAIAATLPSSPGTVSTPSWHYDASDGVTVTTAQNLIYLFETKAKNSGTPTDEFAVVVGGNYQGNTTLSYYRIDIKDASHTSYADVLRNYRYDIEIADVMNAGSTTPDGAFQGGITLNATITAWNAAAQNTTIDPSHVLELDSTVALIPYTGASLNFGVTSSNATHWTIETTNLTNGATATKQSNTVLEIKSTNVNPSTTTEVDCGWIDILVDNMKYKLKVSQAINTEYYPAPHKGWAGSNIYWDGTKMTFDDTGDTSHEQYSGLHFQWGSLWGLDPSGINGSLWDSSKIIYKPDGTTATNVTWTAIPRVNNASITSTPPAGKTDSDRHYLYEIHDGAAGIGDICRYLTEQAGGTLHGKKWRMPTSNEFEAAASYTPSGSFAYTSSNATGTGPIPSGYKKTDTGTPFFPAAGYRHYTNGRLDYVGYLGYYWSGSPYGTNGYCLGLNSSSATPGHYRDRACGYSVRCVQE